MMVSDGSYSNLWIYHLQQLDGVVQLELIISKSRTQTSETKRSIGQCSIGVAT